MTIFEKLEICKREFEVAPRIGTGEKRLIIGPDLWLRITFLSAYSQGNLNPSFRDRRRPSFSLKKEDKNLGAAFFSFFSPRRRSPHADEREKKTENISISPTTNRFTISVGLKKVGKTSFLLWPPSDFEIIFHSVFRFSSFQRRRETELSEEIFLFFGMG